MTILQAGSPTAFSYPIASLKGQIPNATISDNPSMGNTQPITAQIGSDLVYPDFVVQNIIGLYTDLKVGDYEWTIPSGWKTSTGKTGTFVLDATASKNVYITPDNFTSGEIKVRGMNSRGSAGSEYKTFPVDRGLKFINYPASITFGDKTTQSFSVTAFPGVTYEWSAPAGWQVNGQGGASVSITPNFCSSSNATDNKVRVRLKKNNDVSDWLDCPTQIMSPDISIGANVYQYEAVAVTLQNFNLNEMQSVDFSGDGVKNLSNQGDYKIAFLTEGNINLNISILLNGCTAPITFNKQITVNPSRISITGPSAVCPGTTGTFTLNNANTSISWSSSSTLSVTQDGNSTTVTNNATMNVDFGDTRPAISVIPVHFFVA